MSGPFTTITVERFALLQEVYLTADQFLKVVAEFPDDPSTWGGWLEFLETSVGKYKKSISKENGQGGL